MLWIDFCEAVSAFEAVTADQAADQAAHDTRRQL